MGSIDRREDVLSALKLAMQLDNKQDIVINVVDSILTAFSNCPSITIDNDHLAVVDREKFIQELNFYLRELKNK